MLSSQPRLHYYTINNEFCICNLGHDTVNTVAALQSWISVVHGVGSNESVHCQMSCEGWKEEAFLSKQQFAFVGVRVK